MSLWRPLLLSLLLGLAIGSPAGSDAPWLNSDTPPKVVLPGPVLSPDGTSGSPSLSFSSAPTRGIYLRSGTDVCLSTGSSTAACAISLAFVPGIDAARDLGTATARWNVMRGYIAYLFSNSGQSDPNISVPDGALWMGGNTFSSLGAATNGTLVYCSDCTIANPCAGSGTGALAKRLNSVWVCN